MHKLTEQTRKIAQQYRQFWNDADLKGIFSILSLDAEYITYSGSNQTQPDDLYSYIKMALPSSKISYVYDSEIIADAEVATFIYRSVYKSNVTNQNSTYHCCDIMTFKEGKLIRIHEYTSLVLEKSMTKIDGSKKIALDEYRITILTDDLNDYFLTHPYLNNELTLSDVALATGYTRNQISYVLNRSFGKSFYDYINYARINYLLEQLILSYKGNINFLADQAGFNSITTFYKFFKQKTGQTPKAYINNMMK